MPYLRLDSDRNVQLAGYCVFRGDQLKQILNRDETTLFSILKGHFSADDIAYEVHGGKRKGVVVFDVTHGHKSMQLISLRKDQLLLKLDLKLNGAVKNNPEVDDFGNASNYKQLEEQLKKNFDQRIKALLIDFRDNGVDPLGIGDYVKARRSTWDEKQFYENEYGKMDFNVQVNIHLEESGIGKYNKLNVPNASST